MQASQIMAKKAGHVDTPLDVFGWSAQWLVGVLHRPQSNPIVDALSRLVAVTAAGNLPEALSIAAVTGIFSPINKIHDF